MNVTLVFYINPELTLDGHRYANERRAIERHIALADSCLILQYLCTGNARRWTDAAPGDTIFCCEETSFGWFTGIALIGATPSGGRLIRTLDVLSKRILGCSCALQQSLRMATAGRSVSGSQEAANLSTVSNHLDDLLILSPLHEVPGCARAACF